MIYTLAIMVDRKQNEGGVERKSSHPCPTPIADTRNWFC